MVKNRIRPDVDRFPVHPTRRGLVALTRLRRVPGTVLRLLRRARTFRGRTLTTVRQSLAIGRRSLRVTRLGFRLVRSLLALGRRSITAAGFTVRLT